MRIACLGWGSLIWDSRDLPIQGAWQPDGPHLPIEFARQSADGRITLVCVPGYQHHVQSLWIFLSSPTIDASCEALRKREGIKEGNISKHISLWAVDRSMPDPISSVVGSWASSHNLDAVIWTNLPPAFQGKNNQPTAEEVIDYLSQLSGGERQRAEKYIRMTPRQIRTPYRAQIEQTLGWVPDPQAF